MAARSGEPPPLAARVSPEVLATRSPRAHAPHDDRGARAGNARHRPYAGGAALRGRRLSAAPPRIAGATDGDPWDRATWSGSSQRLFAALERQGERGQVVTVFVSRGHEPVAIPNVIGSTPEAATASLQELGFTVVRGDDG